MEKRDAMVIDTDSMNEQIVATIHGRDITRGVLLAAFNRSAPTPNWKTAIDATLDLNDFEMAVTREAVVFFAGCVPTFTPKVGATLPRCRYRVQAVGYYAAVGA
jgi:hypothetical protein